MKRILLLLLTLMLIVIPFEGGAAALPLTEEERALLSVLKLYEFDEKDIESEITRAEFTSMLMKVMGTPSQDGDLSLPFSDVDISHPAAPAIKKALDLGIVASEKKFEPNREITVYEAAKMAVCLLGYAYHANAAGGFPSGFLSIANQRGLLKRIDTGDLFSKSQAARLIFNTLNARYMEQMSFGQEVRLESDGSTILNKYFKMTKKTGIVTATDVTHLTTNKALIKSQIMIDNTLYTSQLQLSGYLGKRVVFYYYYEEDITTQGDIRVMAADDINMKIMRVSADDIVSAGNFIITYEINEDKDQRDLRISKDFDLIYNGVAALSKFLNLNLIPEEGYVVLIDNNNDSLYDTVFVWEYVNYYVSTVIPDSEKAFDKYDSNMVLDISKIEKNSNNCEITLKDENILFTSIGKGDVLSVFESENSVGKTLKIVVTKQTVQGIVDEITDEYYYIDGTPYKISRSYEKAVANKKINLPKIGQEANFALDMEGRISALESDISSVDTEYGYMINVSVSKSIDKKASAQIACSDGDLKIFKFANKINLDGISGVPTDIGILPDNNFGKAVCSGISTSTGAVVTGLIPASKLVRYKLDKNGEISFLDTVLTPESYLAQGFEDNEAIRLDYAPTSLYYRSSIKGFRESTNTNRFIGTDKTMVFKVPTDDIDREETDYAAYPFGQLVSDKTYMVMAYNIEDGARATVMVILENTVASREPSFEDQQTMVEKIATSVNSDGDIAKLLYMHIDSSIKSRVVSKKAESTGILDTLKKGDIIRYTVSSKGEIDGIKVDFTLEQAKLGDLMVDSGADLRGNYNGTFGLLYSRDGIGNVCLLTAGNPQDGYVVSPYQMAAFMLGSTPIYCYNIADNKIKVIPFDELVDYKAAGGAASKMFIRCRYSDVRNVYVYR